MINKMRKNISENISKIRQHPVLVAVFGMLLYFALFQLPFVTSGDIWAEAYMEYLHKALHTGWISVIMPSWEGYVTFLPSFFTKAYVELGASLGMIDMYLRGIAVIFTVGSLAVIASPLTKPLLPRLWQRLVVIAGLILTLWHVSAFSFINIWYVGFIPIVVLALSAVRFKVWQQIFYTLFALAVAFTKPSVILVPFIVYRAIRTKEYISNALILAAVGVQTYLLFFATSNGARNVVQSIWQIVHDMYVGMGTAILKLVQIAPNDLFIVCANIALVLLLVLLILRLGWVRAGLLAFGFAFSVYAYVLAPSADAARPVADASAIFADHYKIQREILISMFLVLSTGLLLPHVWRGAQKLAPRLHIPARVAVLVVTGVALGFMYRPIDTTSHQVALNIAPFRSSLAMQQPVCMPVAPTPSWSQGTNWFMAYGGGCETTGAFSMNVFDASSQTIEDGEIVQIAGHGKHSLMTVMLPVRLASSYNAATFTLQDIATGMQFIGQIKTSQDGAAQFVAFNTSGLAAAESYEFILTTDTPASTMIDDDGAVVVQSYFMLLEP
jgi:hypothetical protein